MKTANQWLKDRLDGTFGDGIDLDGRIYTAAEWDKHHLEMYKAIQLDAMREGALRAAALAPTNEQLSDNHGDTEEQRIGVIDFKDRILTAARNWTTKDL